MFVFHCEWYISCNECASMNSLIHKRCHWNGMKGSAFICGLHIESRSTIAFYCFMNIITCCIALHWQDEKPKNHIETHGFYYIRTWKSNSLLMNIATRNSSCKPPRLNRKLHFPFKTDTGSVVDLKLFAFPHSMALCFPQVLTPHQNSNLKLPIS